VIFEDFRVMLDLWRLLGYLGVLRLEGIYFNKCGDSYWVLEYRD